MQSKNMRRTTKKAGHNHGAHAAQGAYVRRVISDRLESWRGTILVEAPAGYGKSALGHWLCTRAAESERQWVVHNASLDPCAVHLQSLVEESGPSLVIVDNCHDLAPSAQEALGRFVDRYSDFHQFVVIARVPLVGGMTRRIVNKTAVRVSATDLCLDDLAIDLLLANGGLADPSLRVAIARLSGGWPAGICMAINEAELGALDRQQLIERLTRSGGALERYLAEEVLSQLDEDTLSFLESLATLGRFTPSMITDILNVENADALVARIEGQGLFLEALRGDWRSMNPLVASCMEARLRRIDRSRSRSLHLTAAQWHQQNNQLSDAIAHAFAGGDAEYAATLLALSSSTHERIGRWRAFTDWTARLPCDMLDRYVEIRLEAAPAHAVLFEFDAAKEHIARIEEQGNALTDQQAIGLTCAKAILAAFADKPTEAMSAGDLGRASQAPIDAYTRGVFYTASAIGRISRGDIAEAQKLSTEAHVIHQNGSSAFGATFALALRGLTLAIEGRLIDAVADWREGARLIRPSDHAPALEAVASGYLPLALYEWNELDDATQLIERCLASSIEVALPDAIVSIYLTAARIAAIGGDRVSYDRWLNEALALSVRRQWSRLYLAASWERISNALYRQDFAEARRLKKHLDREMHKSQNAIDGTDAEGNCAALRYALHVNGDRASFVELRSAITRARSEGRMWRVARLLTIEANVRERRGDRGGALRAMRAALEIGQKGRLIRTFLDEGDAIGSLIRRVADEEVASPRTTIDITYLDDVLEAAGKPRVLSDDDHWSVEPLSKREAEVLTMVAAGLSNKRIGEHLFMSENTVKWHLQHVFSKLGVANRTSAILVAREHQFIR
jgi:LuxR family transcriptional regulator, maltose regulon positive regulatory protein